MLPEVENALAAMAEAEGRMADSARVQQSLMSGQRPERILIGAGTVNSSFWLDDLGVSMEYYRSSPEVALKAELDALARRLREFPEEDVLAVVVRPNNFANSVVASAYCDVIHFPERTGYRVVPALDSIKDVAKLRVPRPDEIPAVRVLREFAEYYQRQLDGRLTVTVPVGIMPFADAAMIRGEGAFLVDLLESPNEARHLLEIVVETEVRIVKYFWEVLGTEVPEAAGVNDDGAGMLSPKLYEEFCLPYDLMAAKQLSKTGRVSGVHNCGECGHLLPALKKAFDPQSMTISYSCTLDYASSVLGRIPLSGNADPRILALGTKNEIREHVIGCLEQGKRHGLYSFSSGTGSWNDGTSLENLHFAYQIVKEYDRESWRS